MSMLTNAFDFGNKQLRVYGTPEEPWFCGRDVCNILEYSNTKHAIIEHVDIEYISTLECINRDRENLPLTYNQKNLKLINEQGLYCLIFNSKMKAAKKFRKWVFEEVLPSIRKNGHYVSPNATNDQLDQLKKELEQLQMENRNLHAINIELLTYKKLSEKNESIYLVSTYTYIKQGLIKIGRTKNIKSRNSGHNTTHPLGDKVKVLHEFKVNDSTLVENVIHKKLSGLRPDKKSEFFMCPYDLLYDIIDMIINFDEQENTATDKLIDAVCKLKQKNYEYLDWTSGVDMAIFQENMKLIESGDEEEIKRAEFDMTTATKEQKDAFVRDCILSYQKNILIPQKMTTIIWTVFQPHLIKELNITKNKFKALEWKDSFKDVATAEKIDHKMKKA